MLKHATIANTNTKNTKHDMLPYIKITKMLARACQNVSSGLNLLKCANTCSVSFPIRANGVGWVRQQANKAIWYTGQRDVDLTSIVDPLLRVALFSEGNDVKAACRACFLGVCSQAFLQSSRPS